MEFEGAHEGGLHNKVLQKFKNPTLHYALTLLSSQSFSDSNFPEAASSSCYPCSPHSQQHPRSLRQNSDRRKPPCCHFCGRRFRDFSPQIFQELLHGRRGSTLTSRANTLTVSLGVTCAVVYTYGCDDGRIALTR